MTGRAPAAAEVARRETAERLHQQLAEGIATLDSRQAWQQWLDLARSLHSYSFGNILLTMLQRPDATMVAGYRAWQARGHQVRRGEKAIRILGPVLRKMPVLDPAGNPVLDERGEPRLARRVVGFTPVSVFDVSQVEPPVVTPPQPQLLTGEAPPGLWDSLAELVEAEGFTIARGDCGGVNGVIRFADREVRVRDDVDDAQAVRTLAHELGHVLTITDPADLANFVDAGCRGLREVEAESISYMVVRAHGLDAAQYSFSYVAGWASQAATNGESIDDIIQATGQRVIAAVDKILSHTQPDPEEEAAQVEGLAVDHLVPGSRPTQTPAIDGGPRLRAAQDAQRREPAHWVPSRAAIRR